MRVTTSHTPLSMASAPEESPSLLPKPFPLAPPNPPLPPPPLNQPTTSSARPHRHPHAMLATKPSHDATKPHQSPKPSQPVSSPQHTQKRIHKKKRKKKKKTLRQHPIVPLPAQKSVRQGFSQGFTLLLRSDHLRVPEDQLRHHEAANRIKRTEKTICTGVVRIRRCLCHRQDW